jgi:hypothetical protein
MDDTPVDLGSHSLAGDVVVIAAEFDRMSKDGRISAP